MMKHVKPHQTPKGFTLIEIAVVLLIVGLLLGGLLPTLSGQLEQRKTSETRKHLDEIKEVLIGFAIINGSFPCPTTTADPADANYGIADATCPAAGATSDGYLPWKTLGITETDAWGSKRVSASDPWTGYWRYRVDRNFTSTFALNTIFSVDALLIRDNSVNTLTTTTERPVAIVYSTGKNLASDGQNATFEANSGVYQSDVPTPAFDDILIWISRPQLFNRMVMAGRLP